MPASFRLMLLLLALGAVSACTTPDRLTADAIGCPVRDIEIVPSDFQRRGVKTAWCATCKGKRYQCATNAERSRTVCRESTGDDSCL